MRPFHVGDSHLLVVGNRGKVRFHTIPHSPVGYAVEAGVLDEKGAMFHEDRHLVSNILGAEDMRIEVGPVLPLAPRDTLLLASDGVTDNLFLREIIERVRKGPLDDAGARLAAACRKRMVAPAEGQPSKDDDMTFVLYRARRR